MRTKIEALEAAFADKNPLAFEEALVDAPTFEPRDRVCALLTRALEEDWFFPHEDIVQYIQELRCCDAVAVLEKRAIDIPEHLQWDDGFSFSRKCTWALADIGTTDALAALERLARSENSAVRDFAQRRLDRWEAELERKGVHPS
ncbi:hypothetical protein [Aliiroseovarius halocynthiae]|uniref:HEAT repeat domain-containing protein n=1 Tax=Aliiroseovarius halocynthiae TaxID=985055 RepID=A0A545SRF1_9RHOB|nr:hypothetical protein [Aliiroseovarius halocynthiae]TQV67565.1 hypothetical protein FIL88_10120 [Aliiroseovarius halocynthiae]